MDQLAVYQTDDAKQLYRQLNMDFVLNVSYSPQYNPIEAVFSVVKNQIRREKLNRQLNDKPLDMETLVKHEFSKVTRDLVANCAKRSLDLL